MKAWLGMLGGLIVWAGHFFAVYAIGSILPGSDAARLLVALATLVALGVVAWLAASSHRARRASGAGGFARWCATLGLLGCALAAPAILYQALPALIG